MSHKNCRLGVNFGRRTEYPKGNLRTEAPLWVPGSHCPRSVLLFPSLLFAPLSFALPPCSLCCPPPLSFPALRCSPLPSPPLSSPSPYFPSPPSRLPPSAHRLFPPLPFPPSPFLLPPSATRPSPPLPSLLSPGPGPRRRVRPAFPSRPSPSAEPLRQPPVTSGALRGGRGLTHNPKIPKLL